MDKNYNIYIPSDDEEEPSKEDQARLDGYLRARAEIDKVDRMESELVRLRRLNQELANDAQKKAVDALSDFPTSG